MKTPNEPLQDQVSALDFAVEKSMRYHQRRRGFYDRTHKATMFLVVLAGSAAFSGIGGFAWDYFAGFAAVLAAFDLVWNPSHRARDHEMLFRQFSALAITIRTASRPDQSAYEKWIQERIQIETNEPPVYWALEADCDNEVRRARGKDSELVNIDWISRWTMNLLRHERAQYPMTSRAA